MVYSPTQGHRNLRDGTCHDSYPGRDGHAPSRPAYRSRQLAPRNARPSGTSTSSSDEYAVSPDGMKMFGFAELETTFEGCRFALGIRNSHDRSMRLGITVGFRVMVCMNMAFSGDFTPVLSKHSKHFNSDKLRDDLAIGVDRMQRNFEPMQRQVAGWRESQLTDDQAKVIIYRAFVEDRIGGSEAHSETGASELLPTGVSRVRAAHALQLAQRVHLFVQSPRCDPAIQSDRRTRRVSCVRISRRLPRAKLILIAYLVFQIIEFGYFVSAVERGKIQIRFPLLYRKEEP